MKCVICKNGVTSQGVATVMLERHGTVVVFTSVPADICDNCGERYYNEHTTEQLLQEADKAARAGVQVEIKPYAAA